MDTGLVRADGSPLLKVEKTYTPPLILGSTLKGGARAHPRRYDWRTYNQMYEQHPTVYAAINKIVKVATNTGFEFVPRGSRSEVSEQEAKFAKDTFDNFRNFKQALQTAYLHLLVFGDAYLYIVPNRRRKPSRLKPLMPWTMGVNVKKNGEVSSYTQQDPDDPRDRGVSYRPHEIIHIRMFNPKDEVFGLSPLEALKSAVLTDIMAERFNRNYFKNGAATGTIFIVNNATDQEIEKNIVWIREQYSGTENAHKPVVVTGDVKVERSVATHAEMGFLEGREAIEKQILAVLDVPPAKLGHMETANRSNSKEQDKTFRTESVMPLQDLVETAINDHLLVEVLGITQILFKHTESDVRDKQEQMDLWTKAVQNGIKNINEIRLMMGDEPIEGGDINYVMTPTGAVPVVDMELYFKLPRTNLDKIPQELHGDHGSQTHPSNGGEGLDSVLGPKPKRSKPSAGVLESPANKTRRSDPLHLTLNLLTKAYEDEATLRHCYAYACDARDDDPENQVADAVTAALGKAVRAADDVLRQTYIERAHAMLMQAIDEEGGGHGDA